MPFFLQAETGPSSMGPMLLMFAVIFGIFYLLLIRPEKRKQELHQEMLKSLKKDDRVLTQGGIIGIVKNVKDDEVTLLIDEDAKVKVRVGKSFVVGRVGDKTSGEPEAMRTDAKP